MLVIPIDKAAPKGRLILPQQQVIRDVLEADGAAICVKEYELRGLLDTIGKRPAMVIRQSGICKSKCRCARGNSAYFLFYFNGKIQRIS